MISVAEQTKRILDYLPNLPQEISESTVEIVAKSGRVEIVGIHRTDKSAVDNLFIDNYTETEATSINRALRLNITDGNCILYFNDNTGSKKEIILNPFNSKRITPNTMFILKTNGLKCCAFLVMEAVNG